MTEGIIGATIQVHRSLGPGFNESICEKALVIELRKREFEVDQQRLLTIEYDGVEVGRKRLDLLINGVIIIELKVVEELNRHHFAQVKSYLKAAELKHGLLLNFSKDKLEMKRVIFER